LESILKTELEQKLLTTCETVLINEGFRIVDIDLHITGRSLIRIFIERLKKSSTEIPSPEAPNSDGSFKSASTSIEDCVKATHVLSPLLEADTLVPGAFDLEVSSPGLDRRLRLKSDFENVIGQMIKLKLTENLGRGASLTGTLNKVGDRSVIVKTDGKLPELEVPFDKIKRANVVWQLLKN
jgi:ribosome maturation factor RimP